MQLKKLFNNVKLEIKIILEQIIKVNMKIKIIKK